MIGRVDYVDPYGNAMVVIMNDDRSLSVRGPSRSGDEFMAEHLEGERKLLHFGPADGDPDAAFLLWVAEQFNGQMSGFRHPAGGDGAIH